MSKDKLIDILKELHTDITLIYRSEEIFIDPHGSERFLVCYKDDGKECTSIDETLSSPIIDGKSLSDICEDLEVT